MTGNGLHLLDGQLLRKVRKVAGCLKHLAAKDKDAERHLSARQDDDGWMFDLMPPYEVDEVKLLNSKGLRREPYKAQVIILPENCHARNRRGHTDEVVSVAVPTARILGLNIPLCRAGSLAHDIGHAPFGHRGERFLTEVAAQAHDGGHPREFRHEIFGVIVAQDIERKGRGLNLCRRTLSCIRCHSRGAGEMVTGLAGAEEDVVMYADKIAYVMADFNDLFSRNAVSKKLPRLEDFPKLAKAMEWFGDNQRQRVGTCIAHLCLESAKEGKISFSKSEAGARFKQLKDLMYEVYPRVNPLKFESGDAALAPIFAALKQLEPKIDPYILFALMTDADVAILGHQVSRGWIVSAEDLMHLSIADVIPNLRGRVIDFTKADLDWPAGWKAK